MSRSRGVPPDFYRVLALYIFCAVALVARAEEWISIGPFGTALENNDVISGQVNRVAVHPYDANTIFIGASEGGIWKTTDGGASWRAVTDTQLVRKQASGKSKGTLSIGAIAINPANPRIIYAGTGEPHIACDSLFGPALGVFRSTDGGETWTPTGVNLTQCENFAMGRVVVNRLLIIPESPPVVAEAFRRAVGGPTVPKPVTRILAATNVGLFIYNEDSNDCWTRITNGLPSGNAVDIVADPFQRALYVAFRSQGIFKSDGIPGAQWKKLTQGLPASGFGWISLAYGGRTCIGFSQPVPLLYAAYNANGPYRLFRTVDGGDNWAEMPSPPSENQVEFNNAIAVDPFDSNKVYVGQVALWRAFDGGAKGGLNNFRIDPPVTDKSWTNLSCCLPDENPSRFGMDLHADNHDIVFAAPGSFQVSREQNQIVYVANDGGLAKGVINFDGAVTWQPLTKGLAIGQNGTIGLSPIIPELTAAGVWHNGDILLHTGFSDSFPIAGGDGFQASIDAGNLVTFVNCNAGFGGAICRVLPPAPFHTNFKSETIWSDNSAQKHWSDPHRPGHLLRLQNNGLLFRTSKAVSGTPSELNSSDAWEAVDPFWGKTGKTTTMAFRSRVLEEAPVYYLGTDTGQIWRGSPEVGWTKLSETGARVNAIAADLFRNERLFVALNAPTSPGRIKEVNRLPNGQWETKNIDTTFNPDLELQMLVSIAVDPTVPESRGTTVYVGTDQGVYRGHVPAPLVLDPTTIAAAARRPPTLRDWTWRRSPGVPNVWVLDLEVHQNFQGQDRSGIVRAGTFGRGIYELRQVSAPGVVEKPPLTLAVSAMRIGEDGAPAPLAIKIPIAMKEEKANRETPFEVPVDEAAEVVLEAPREIREGNAIMRFVGWSVPGQKPGREARLTLKLSEAGKAVAYYEVASRVSEGEVKPLRVSVTAAAREVCQRSFTHELSLTWEITDGRRPVSTRAEIVYPDQRVEHHELKSLDGTRPIPMDYPGGGEIKVKVTAIDGSKEPASAEATVKLKACKK